MYVMKEVIVFSVALAGLGLALVLSMVAVPFVLKRYPEYELSFDFWTFTLRVALKEKSD